MSDRSSKPVLPRAPGGHEARLVFSEGVTLGRPVTVRELNPADPAVQHEILANVMAEHAAGTITTYIRYKGRHPERWFPQLYPATCKPRVLGFYFPDGTLLGWLTVSTSPAAPGLAILGMVIRPPYRDAGLGTAAVLHVAKHLAAITRDPAVTDVFFETQAGNRRVIHVAHKVQVAPAGSRVDALKGGITMLQFSSKRRGDSPNDDHYDDDPGLHATVTA